MDFADINENEKWVTCDHCGLTYDEIDHPHTNDDCEEFSQYTSSLQHEEEIEAQNSDEFSMEEKDEIEKFLNSPDGLTHMYNARLKSLLFDHVPYKFWRRVCEDSDLRQRLITVIHETQLISKIEEPIIKFISLCLGPEGEEQFNVRYHYSSSIACGGRDVYSDDLAKSLIEMITSTQ